MDYYQNMIQATNQKNSFMLHNGIRLTKMERDHAVVEADLTRVNRNLYGAVHGGLRLRRGRPKQRDALRHGEQQL